MKHRNILFLISILAVVLILTLVFQKTGIIVNPTMLAVSVGNNSIYTLSYSPEEPKISESLTITAGVQNNGNEEYGYKLIILVVKDGQIKENFEYPFNLKPGRSISFSPTYIPDDIGVFEIVAKLYDKYETALIDSKIVTFSSISDIGPFDLILDVLSNVARPTQSIPAILTLENNGEKGTDVEVRVEMDCINQMDITQTFFIFLEAGSTLDKKVVLPACNEIGIHDISAEIILYNKTWISSMNQILLNESYLEVSYHPLDIFRIDAGESKIFDLSVKNSGNVKISNLKILIEDIPLEWFKITPSSITEISPNETVVFLINFSIPSDATPKNYSIKIDASTDQALEKQDSTLEITSLAAYPVSEETGKGGSVSLPITSFIKSNLTIIIIVIGVVISVLLIFKFKDRIFSRKIYHYEERTVLGGMRNALGRKNFRQAEAIKKIKNALEKKKS